MNKMPKPLAIVIAASALWLGACSGPSEDPRITFCKALVSSAHGGAATPEWTGNENAFKRPEYATVTLSYTLASGAAHSSACYFAYDAIEDTAQHLGDPLSAYATLPFAMTVDGRMLSDAELVSLRSAEQVRQGRKALAALESNARELAARVRAGIGQ